MTPSQHAKVLEAIDNALEWDFKRNYAMPYKVRDPLFEALSIMRAEGVGEPQGWKMVGWTCGDGDCGRIHDQRPDDDDHYMQAVYVMTDVPAPPEPSEVKP